MTETPADEYRQAAAELRDVAPMIDGPLAGLADPVADWLDQAAKHHDATVIGAASVWQRPDEAAYRDAFVTKQTDRAALAVARQLLGTSVCPECGTSGACNGGPCPLGTATGQPATAPWPSTGVERPDHALYTLLRRAGLTPEAAQQEIDTYTQTIRTQPAPAVNRAAVLNERADFFEGVLRNAADPEGDPRYWSAISDVIRGLRQQAAEAQQPTPAETEAHQPEHTWAAELHDPLADEWVPGTRYLVRDRAVNALEHARKIAAMWKDGTPTERRLVRATTTYTVEPTPAPAEETVAACKCGHPQERHVLLSGTYAQCRHKYPEAGRPKCRCGMYRPQSDAPDVAEEPNR